METERRKGTHMSLVWVLSTRSQEAVRCHVWFKAATVFRDE